MGENGGRRSSGSGASGSHGGQDWRRLQAERMDAVWSEISSAAEALGEGMRSREGDAGPGANQSADDDFDRNRCLELLLTSIDLYGTLASTALDAIEQTAKALVPVELVPLVLFPSRCVRRVLCRGIDSVHDLFGSATS